MSNKNKTTLYKGLTNDFERIFGMQNVIDREKKLKRRHKDWKWNLIKEANPELKDLSEGWYDDYLLE